nr:MarR family transcriptional regulator [Phyllobacterium ifriqiyense]
MKELGLTQARARTLLLLDRLAVLNQKELAEELDIETPTMVRLLDGLESQGFIQRKEAEGDRRAKEIHITVTGRTLAKKVNDLAQKLRADVLAGIESEDLQNTVDVLRSINRNINELDERD